MYELQAAGAPTIVVTKLPDSGKLTLTTGGEIDMVPYHVTDGAVDGDLRAEPRLCRI